MTQRAISETRNYFTLSKTDLALLGGRGKMDLSKMETKTAKSILLLAILAYPPKNPKSKSAKGKTATCKMDLAVLLLAFTLPRVKLPSPFYSGPFYPQ